MNPIKKRTIALFILGTSYFSCYAQFNTVESFRITHRHKSRDIKTNKAITTMPTDSLENDYSNMSTHLLVSLPLKKIKVNSGYGKRFHPITKKYILHNGIDLRAKYEEVFSMLPGYIHKVGEDRISGKYIMIVSGDFLISYCHLSKIEVQKGKQICAGDRIGISGNTGRSTGAHLHITCRLNGKIQDPAFLLKAIQKIKGATPAS